MAAEKGSVSTVVRDVEVQSSGPLNLRQARSPIPDFTETVLDPTIAEEGQEIVLWEQDTRNSIPTNIAKPRHPKAPRLPSQDDNREEEVPSLTQLLRDSKSYPLLRAEEELALGKTIFTGKLAFVGLAALDQTSLVTPDQQRAIDDLKADKKVALLYDALNQQVANEKKGKGNATESLIGAYLEGVNNKIQDWLDGDTDRTDIDNFVASNIRLVEDGKAAFDTLVLSNIRLGVKNALKFQREGITLEELNSFAYEGTMRATAKFDYRMGFRFSTYATWWIRQAIQRGVIDEGALIRIPTNLAQDVRKSQRIGEGSRSGHVSSSQETMNAARRTQYVLSLDAPVGADPDGRPLGHFIPDETTDFTQDVDKKETEKEVAELLSELNEREAYVLRLRFGIGSGISHTLEEVGRDLGVTRERVRQIEAKAMRNIRLAITARASGISENEPERKPQINSPVPPEGSTTAHASPEVSEGSVGLAEVLSILGISENAYYNHKKFGLKPIGKNGVKLFYSRDDVLIIKQQRDEKKKKNQEKKPASLPAIKIRHNAENGAVKIGARSLIEGEADEVDSYREFINSIGTDHEIQSPYQTIVSPPDIWEGGVTGLQEFIQSNFRVLTPDQLAVMEAISGLADGIERTSEEASKYLHMPPKKAAQLEAEAFSRLRNAKMSTRIGASLQVAETRK